MNKTRKFLSVGFMLLFILSMFSLFLNQINLNTFNSNSSNNPLRDAPVSGVDAGNYIITSNWMTENVIIDGNLTNSAEWSDATILQLTQPEFSMNATLYFKNNITHLAIFCDAYGDLSEDVSPAGTTFDDLDHFDVGFDTGNDQIRTDNSEDSFIILANSTMFHWNYSIAQSGYVINPILGIIGSSTFGATINHGASHEAYELLIPLSVLSTTVGETVGIASLFDSAISTQGWPFDQSTSQVNNYPKSVQENDMATWGKLILAQAPASSTLTDTGDQGSALLFYTNSTTGVNSDTASDFTIPVSVDEWGLSYTNLTFSNLAAPDYWLNIEDDTPTLASGLTSYIHMGFNITNYCTLTNFSVLINEQFLTGNDMRWRIYNSTYLGVRPEPSASIASGLFTTDSTSAYWENVTGLSVVLNPSQTKNNTFFLSLRDDTSFGQWRGVPDATDGVDDGIAYVGQVPTLTYLANDYKLLVGLSPISNTPTPAQVNMQVNGSGVDVNGNWQSTKRVTSNTGQILLNVSANWDLSYTIDYNVEFNKTVNTNTNYIINSGGNANWWMNWSSQFPSNANNYQINVSIPLDWSVTDLWNGTSPNLSPYDSNHWVVQSLGSQQVVIIKNLTDVTSQDWALNCMAPNYITDIELFRMMGTYQLLGPNPIVKITDILHVNATISSPLAGLITDSVNGATLNIYLPSIRTCYSEKNLPISNGLANFTDWYIADSTNEEGGYTIQVVWKNGTEVGLDDLELQIIYPTSTKLIVDQAQESIPAFVDWYIGIGNQHNITVFYNNTFIDKLGGITTTNASYQIINETGLWIPWSPLSQAIIGKGYYDVILDVGSWENGTYIIGINLNKTGYQLQEFNITVNLVVNTELILVNPASSTVNAFYPENMTFRVNYSKSTGEEITFASVFCRVNGSTPIDLGLDGLLYKIQLNSTSYGIGTYNVSVYASTSGYKDRMLSVIWIVQACPTNYIVTVNGSYTQNEFYYGEKMRVTISAQDTQHTVPLLNALVNLTVQGSSPITITDEGDGDYSWVFDSSSRSAGLWNITLQIQKPNYENHTTYIQIYAKYNMTLEWVIPPPAEIRPGDPLRLAVKLSYNPAVANETIKFIITTNINTETHERMTNASGIAEYYIDAMPSSITSLTVEIVYDGNVTYFDVGLSETSVRIIRGGFLEQYWWVFLIGAVLMVVGVATVRVRRKSKAAKELAKKEILTSFQDVTKILHLVVIHKNTGADIFDYRIQERLDPTLLAGFIQAVKEFGKEIYKEDE